MRREREQPSHILLAGASGSGEALSSNNGIFYYLSDHPSAALRVCAEPDEVTGLGSTSMHINSSSGAAPNSEARYHPYGAWRTTPTQTISDRGYTGQLENTELGLSYYNARFYLPSIGRFASADTIVPQPGSPQSLNRYTYGLNNPIKYADPTGHYVVNFEGDDKAAPNPFEQEMTLEAADDCAQASWDRMMWSIWTGDEELAEGYRLEVAPYLMKGWLPGGAWSDWSYTEALVHSVTADRDDDVAFLIAAAAVHGGSNSNWTGARYTGSAPVITSHAARRQVMRELNIPTSQQPVQYYQSGSSRTYLYEVPAPGGGSRLMVVAQHPAGDVHGPHWEGGMLRVDESGNATCLTHTGCHDTST